MSQVYIRGMTCCPGCTQDDICYYATVSVDEGRTWFFSAGEKAERWILANDPVWYRENFEGVAQ